MSWVYIELWKYLKSIPQGNSKVPQWTIGNGNIVPAWNAYGYIGTGQRYILSYQFIDTRDGQRYKAVRMPDERRWMAENLNFKTANSSCYNDVESNCDNDYGRMYTQDDAQIACPQWWKLPTRDERITMLNAVEGVYGGIQNHGTQNSWNGTAAGKNLQNVQSGSVGSDLFGFSAILAGRYEGGYMDRDTTYAFFWDSDSVWGNNHFFHKWINWAYFNTRNKNAKLSVRCIQ